MTGRVISDKVGGPGGPRNECRHATAGHFRDPVRNRFSTCRHPPQCVHLRPTHRPKRNDFLVSCCCRSLLCSALWPIVAQYNHSTTALPIHMNCSVTDMFFYPSAMEHGHFGNKSLYGDSIPSPARPVKRNIRIGNAIDVGSKKKAKSMATLIL